MPQINENPQSRKYYWNKLPFDFWDRPTTRAILNMANGAAIIILFQKMVKEAANRDGYLRFTESEPYTAETLTLLGFNVEVCKDALVTLQRFNFINVLDDGTIYIVDIEKFVGSRTAAAVRKEEYRKKKKPARKDNVGTMSGQCPDKNGTKMGQCPTSVPQMSQKCPIEIDKEKEKEIEKDRDKERDDEDRPTRPTLKDIEVYITSKGLHVDPSTFFNYYQAREWIASGGADVAAKWETFVDLWEAREKNSVRGNLTRLTAKDAQGVAYMTRDDYDMTRDDTIELLTDGEP